MDRIAFDPPRPLPSASAPPRPEKDALARWRQQGLPLAGLALLAGDLLSLLWAPESDFWMQVLPALHAATLLLALFALMSLWQQWQHARHTAAQLADGIAALDEGFVLFDAKDQLVAINDAFRQTCPQHSRQWPAGSSFEDMLRSSVYAGEVVAAVGQEEDWLRQRMAMHHNPGEPWLQALSDGSWVRVHERCTPSGARVGLRTDVTDMVARERMLQMHLAHEQALISAAGVALITLDERGAIRSANPVAERVLGCAEAELLQRDLGRLLDVPGRVLLLRYLRLLRSGSISALPDQQCEIAVLQRNGCKLTVQLVLSEVRGGDERLFVAALTDISERKRFEIELQGANERLLRLSTTDALTELANRRLLMQRLEDEWRRAARSREPLSLLLVDVDFFKLYNDHYGHQAGDNCLQIVASVLSTATQRHTDLAARYGGEEFVLLLPQTGEEGALTVAERISEILRERALEHAASPLGPHLSLSMGLASGLPDPSIQASANASQWLSQADAALYQAKAQGRNRVVRAPRLGPLPSVAGGGRVRR